MVTFTTVLFLAVTLFAATNVDDLFVLLGFFADPQFQPREIICGQFLGIGALVLVSLAAALVALAIPPADVSLLGLLPFAIGCKKLADLWRGREQSEEELEDHAVPAQGSRGRILAVMAVTIANGGDNVGAYTPLFAIHPGLETAMIIGVYAVMTAFWCLAAHWMVNHRTLGAPIRRYGHRLLPFVLIGLGLMILQKGDMLEMLAQFILR